MYHKRDERLKSHIFLTMLAYYIQWNATEKLAELFESDGTHNGQRWTFKIVTERLKSIRKTECLVNGILVKHEISVPDAEQQKILDLLNIKLA